MTRTNAGAMPARSDSDYPFGSEWASYRLPFPGINGILDARSAGVGFEGEAGDPPAPPASDAKPPADPTKAPATGDDDAPLGEPGKAALRREREAREAAERELATLRKSSLSEPDKALETAREEGRAAIRAELDAARKEWEAEKADLQAQLTAKDRDRAVEAALRTAGITNENTLRRALAFPEFTALRVQADGSVKDLDAAVAKVKADSPEMFTGTAVGTVARGTQTGAHPDKPRSLGDAVAARLGA
jgi:hypothetical protein